MSGGFDPIYFQNSSWKKRVQDWLDHEGKSGTRNPFLDGNVEIVRKILEEKDTGLRMVVNIGAEALLSFLRSGIYKNIYDEPIIGGKAHKPSPERITVDALLGFGTNAHNFFFGAAALGGTGVRFYGEYCMVIKPECVSGSTGLFDRDSYDLLEPPLKDYPKQPDLPSMLRGAWSADIVDMLLLKMLPELRDAHRLITVGTVSELVLRDQEFIEIHLRDRITPSHVEEIRQSPDEAALEAVISARKQLDFKPSAVEMRWLRQRHRVFSALETMHLRHRTVTLHGRGYQWR